MTEGIDEGYEEKEIDKQVKNWDRHIGQWVFDGVKPGYSPQTERALRISPEVRVPVSEEAYEKAQNSPKSESWRRSLNKYKLGQFVPEEHHNRMTQEEPVFPVFDDEDDNVKKVSKLRRSKSLHSKHKITVPPCPASATSIPMNTSANSPTISSLSKVQAKPRPHSAATAPLHNASESSIKSFTPTKSYNSTTPLKYTKTPTGSPVKSATPTKPSVTTPTHSEDTNSLVNNPRPPTAGNVSSVTPPVVGNLVQEKAKLFGPTANVKRSQSLSTRNYQRPVKHLQHNKKFGSTSPPVTSPKNTTSPHITQNTSPPVSDTKAVEQSSVKELTNSPIDVPWQAAMTDSEGIPWQARAASNSIK